MTVPLGVKSGGTRPPIPRWIRHWPLTNYPARSAFLCLSTSKASEVSLEYTVERCPSTFSSFSSVHTCPRFTTPSFSTSTARGISTCILYAYFLSHVLLILHFQPRQSQNNRIYSSREIGIRKLYAQLCTARNSIVLWTVLVVCCFKLVAR